MICAAILTASATKATAKPMPIPSAASETIHTASSPTVASPPTCGQYGASATVMLMAMMIRAISMPVRIPGSGTNTKTPATRASVNRKPSSVAVGTDSSPCIPAQVSEDRHRVRRHLLYHPGQGDQEAHQERAQPRNGAEGGVLNRRHDLQQAHRDAD